MDNLPLASGIQNQGFGWRQPTRRLPMPETGNFHPQMFDQGAIGMPIDQGVMQIPKPPGFGGQTMPGGVPGPTLSPRRGGPIFLGPPIRPGMTNHQGFGWRG